jgi:hypothetical protein
VQKLLHDSGRFVVLARKPGAATTAPIGGQLIL